LRRDTNEAESREQIKHKKRKKGDGHDMDVEKEEKVSKKKKMIFIFRVGKSVLCTLDIIDNNLQQTYSCTSTQPHKQNPKLKHFI